MNNDDVVFFAIIIILWLTIYYITTNFNANETQNIKDKFSNIFNSAQLTKCDTKNVNEYYMINELDDNNLIDYFKTYTVKYKSLCAMKVYRNDTWLNITYEDYYSNSIQFATALTKNCGKNCVVGLLGCNSPAWYYTYWGTIISEGTTIGIDMGESFDKIKYIIKNTNINVVLIDDVKQLDKIKELSKDEINNLELIVTYTNINDSDYINGIHIVSFNDLINNVDKDEINEFISTIDTTNTQTQVPTIICTNDNSNNGIKKISISQQNIISTLANIIDMFNDSDLNITIENERFLSYLPLNNMTTQMFDIYMPLTLGGTIWFADRSSMTKKSILKTIKRVNPTIFIGTPHIWNNIANKIDMTVDKYGKVGKYIKPFIKTKITSQLGLNECKYCATTKMLSDDTYDELNNINIFVYNMCCMDEICGIMSLCLPYSNTTHYDKIGSSGKIMSKLKIKINKDGEILAKGPMLFLEYDGDYDKTIKAIDNKGWFYTGHLGTIDIDNYLYITGQKDEYIENSKNNIIYPKPIEEQIKDTLSFIDNVIILNGEGKNNLTVVITLHHKIKNNSEIDTLVKLLIDEINDTIPKPFKLNKWHICNDKFRIGKELTPNKKLRRKYINQKYEKLI